MTYPRFWVLGMISNGAAAAQLVALNWLLASPVADVLVLATYQIAATAASLVGLVVGAALVHRLGTARLLSLSSWAQAGSSILVALIALGASASNPEVFYVLAIAGCSGPAAAAAGAPSWLAIVRDWRDEKTPESRLLLDSTQFQLGRMVGPVVGGLAVMVSSLGLQLTCALNAVSFIVVALVVRSLRAQLTSERVDARPTLRSYMASFQKISPWLYAAVVLSTDSARIYLPKFLQAASESPLFYSFVIATMAVSAALSTALVSAAKPRRVAVFLSIMGVGVALIVWSLSTWFGIPAWFVGAALLGGSSAVAIALLTSITMTETAGNGPAAIGSTVVVGTRAMVGVVGGAAVGFVYLALGLSTLSLLAAPPLVGALFYAHRKLRPRSPGLH